jgi:hypothetical protein
MAGSKMTVTGDYRPGNIKQATRDLTTLEKQAKGFSSSFTSAFTGMGAAIGGAFALTEVVQFLKDSAQAAMDDEKSMVALATAMDNVGLSAKNAEAEGLLNSMALQYGMADDRLRPAYQKLVTATKDVAEAQALLQTAMDLSAAGYGDLESASKALSAAAAGNFTALTRLKVPIDQNIIKAKDFDGAVQALNKTVGGQAAAAAETYQGKLDRLTVAVGEAQEAIGYSLLSAVERLVNGMGGVGGLQQVIIRTGDQLADFIDRVALSAEGVNTFSRKMLELGTFGLLPASKKIDVVGGAFEAFVKTVVDFLGGPLPLLMGALRDLGFISEDTANAQKAQTSATVSSAVAAGKAIGNYSGLADATDDMGDSAWYATKSYLALWESIYAAQRAERDFAGTSGTVSSALAEGARIGGVAGYWEKLRVKYGEAEKAVRSVGSASRESAPEVSKFAENVKSAEESLASLATEMPNYIQDMSTPTFAMLNGQIDALKSAFLEAKQFVESTISSFVGQLDLGAALEESKKAGSSLVEAFVSQGEKVVEFGRKVNALVKQGLERPAWSAIMALGYERGTEVADKLAEGNVAGNIANVNKVYESVKTMGDEVAELAKVKFYDVGMQTMITTLEAMIEQLMPAGKKRKQLLAMLDDLAGSMYRKTYIDVEVRGPGITGPAYEAPTIAGGVAGGSTATPAILTSTPVPAAAGNFYGGIRLFAEGGIATRPTPGIFGEAGPEALIPLDRMGDFGGGNTYNINVTAGVGDPRAIGKSVVEAITLFERSSGPVFARA